MWKWGVMVLAALGAVFAIILSFRGVRAEPVPPPHREPVRNPYPKGLAGSGLIEPASESVVIGVSEQGRVTKVFVEEGQAVKKGDPLFQIDPRAMEAELVTAKAAVFSAEAELKRIEAFRRKEEEPMLRAQIAQAEAGVENASHQIDQALNQVTAAEWQAKDQEARKKRLVDPVLAAAVPEQDLERVEFAMRIAQAQAQAAQDAVLMSRAAEAAAKGRLKNAQAELALFLAGPWPPDVAKARAALEEAKARVTRMDMEIERRTVRAPLDAVVLRRKLREGEYAMANSPLAEDAVIVLGNLQRLHVRVDIDEFDAHRFKPGLRAVVKLKGEADKPIALEFVRVEPFVVPKRALTNSQRELVDTRVLQVVYRIGPMDVPIYVGQQVDVFMDTE